MKGAYENIINLGCTETYHYTGTRDIYKGDWTGLKLSHEQVLNNQLSLPTGTLEDMILGYEDYNDLPTVRESPISKKLEARNNLKAMKKSIKVEFELTEKQFHRNYKIITEC